jgi:hypothetical protein
MPTRDGESVNDIIDNYRQHVKGKIHTSFSSSALC